LHARYNPLMRSLPSLPCLLLLAAALLPACATAPRASSSPENEPEVVVGLTDRDALEAAAPEWVAEQVAAQIDSGDALALASVPPGAEVTVFLGTWCSDSRREVARFWRALDETGGLVPFEIRWVGVDRDKEEPAELLDGVHVLYVPTFIVRRDGEEVGRIVEESPHAIETDLLALLEGRAGGVVTARDDADELAP
jgi:thiol-disulfide isomerase/thioredoxin